MTNNNMPCPVCCGESTVVVVPASFLLALRKYLDLWEIVFGDADWPTTLDNLQDSAMSFIAPGGTFLEPGVSDEANNWHNRAALLAAYRKLRSELDRPSFRIIEPTA